MSDTPNYRLSFQITDETSGETIIDDFCSFSAASVHADGGCETVDHQVAAGLRAFNRLREKHEKQYVTQTAARIRAAVED